MMAEKEKLKIHPKSGYGLIRSMISEFQKCTHDAQNYFPGTITDSKDDGRKIKITNPT